MQMKSNLERRFFKHEEIGFEVHLDYHYEEMLENVTAAQKTQGFGVLTHIDLKSTLREKLGEDFRPYSIWELVTPTWHTTPFPRTV